MKVQKYSYGQLYQMTRRQMDAKLKAAKPRRVPQKYFVQFGGKQFTLYEMWRIAFKIPPPTLAECYTFFRKLGYKITEVGKEDK